MPKFNGLTDADLILLWRAVYAETARLQGVWRSSVNCCPEYMEHVRLLNELDAECTNRCLLPKEGVRIQKVRVV